jgi:hypothetical protein
MYALPEAASRRKSDGMRRNELVVEEGNIMNAWLLITFVPLSFAFSWSLRCGEFDDFR